MILYIIFHEQIDTTTVDVEDELIQFYEAQLKYNLSNVNLIYLP